MAKQTAKGRIVTSYLDKYPEMPSLTMAKLIVAENPLDFKDAETVRTLIRNYRGALGQRTGSLNPLSNGKYHREISDKNLAPYKLPDEDDVDILPYHLPKHNDNIGVLSDIHIPNHRNNILQLACNHFKENNCNTIILNGDVLDNTPFTRHEGKRPTPKQVRIWFDKTELFFEWLRDSFPNADIYWTEGNHDFWYRRWMMQHAWQLDEDPYYSLQARLHIDEYKIKFIAQSKYLLAGKLGICHGHWFMGKFGGGVAPARTVYLKTKKSMVIGHVHTTNEYTETDLSGDITTCYSTGCMCTLTPEYQPMGGKSNHGFGHAIIHKDGNFNFRNYRIHKGVIL